MGKTWEGHTALPTPNWQGFLSAQNMITTSPLYARPPSPQASTTHGIIIPAPKDERTGD